MKKILFLAITMSLALCAMAQNQQGYVKTKGRLNNDGKVVPGKYLNGVVIQVKGYSPVITDSQGRFSIPVDGGTFMIQSVKKQGYDLIDKDALQQVYHYSSNPLVIIMESDQQLKDDRLAIERKIRRTMQRQLQAQEDEIEALMEQNRITKDEYQKKLEQLYAEQENREKLISNMAERYLQTDYDQMDEFNLRINDCILNGKLVEADSLLQSKGDIRDRLKALEESQELLKRQAIDLAIDCKNRGQISEIEGNINEALTFYNKAMSLFQFVLEMNMTEIQQLEEKIKELQAKQ
ncbi:MAG: hypothetical protein IJG42_07385 [Muribaculaceae bacterium]|nr:hypothetical protein [Muribaculaceae bacterium]